MSLIPRSFKALEDLAAEPEDGDEDVSAHPGGPADPSLRRIVGGFLAGAIFLACILRLLHAA
jgi:hypothetical protein